ncbi:Gfo/Idh/MocA family oxidoreductase [Neobacillus sp. CF12]|uniref:Gfo/Idh/MocA family protein n=1 Tax=Neobacillus sp. CF12 TaxID=3055864 RepID=UPI0025A0EFDA|nr:Gfo/Idh/MocA family oxidoreductase [Neobacillus sp. CF12]MDM5327517.1 Gfo/Idh/MocA family oxidoreductase [Neobacillus sp. CF12]
MSFSENTRLGELLKSEAAKAVLEKHFPGFTTTPRLALAQGFSLKVMSGFPQSQITPDQLKACVEDLEKLEETDLETIKVKSVQKYKRIGFKNDLKWGIMGPGKIAKKLAEAIEGTEGSELYAVASRSMDRAKTFSEEFNVQKVYGSYEELVEDSAVDVVYIANLKTQHFESAKLALHNKKAVLLEKPLTINAEQAEELITIAHQKNVFLMEAMWMRYNPNITKLKELINEGTIGNVKKIEADFSFECEPDSVLRFPEFGGGALLDLGIYPISFANWIVGRIPDTITSKCVLASTGVDGVDSVTFEWKTGEKAELSFGIDCFRTMSAKVTGTDGYIEVFPPFHGAQVISLHNSQTVKEFSIPFRINGYEYEVEEVMRCLDTGLKESSIMPLDETLSTMKLMDRLRSEWGVVFPCEI